MSSWCPHVLNLPHVLSFLPQLTSPLMTDLGYSDRLLRAKVLGLRNPSKDKMKISSRTTLYHFIKRCTLSLYKSINKIVFMYNTPFNLCFNSC